MPPEPKARVANTRCGLANFPPVEHIQFFTIPWPKVPKVPLSLSTPKRERGIFGPCMVKHSNIHTQHGSGIKRNTPEHMFATLAFCSEGNSHVPSVPSVSSQLFTSLVAYILFPPTEAKNSTFPFSCRKGMLSARRVQNLLKHQFRSVFYIPLDPNNHIEVMIWRLQWYKISFYRQSQLCISQFENFRHFYPSSV